MQRCMICVTGLRTIFICNKHFLCNGNDKIIKLMVMIVIVWLPFCNKFCIANIKCVQTKCTESEEWINQVHNYMQWCFMIYWLGSLYLYWNNKHYRMQRFVAYIVPASAELQASRHRHLLNLCFAISNTRSLILIEK